MELVQAVPLCSWTCDAMRHMQVIWPVINTQYLLLLRDLSLSDFKRYLTQYSFVA